jgi:hypothetical protein
MRRSLAALVLLAAVSATACGGPPPTASTTAGNSTQGPSPASPGDAIRHADPELEALLPTTLGGVLLTRESQRGADLSRQSDALDRFLEGLGRTIQDFTLASAYSASGDLKAQVGAWRVRGADTGRLMSGFIEAIQASSTTKLTLTELSIGSHQVTQIGAAGQLTQGPLYSFVRDQTVLFVQTTEPALAEEALASLP